MELLSGRVIGLAKCSFIRNCPTFSQGDILSYISVTRRILVIHIQPFGGMCDSTFVGF